MTDAKIVVLGSQGVGKTSLITRYSHKKFIGTTSPTIGASFQTLQVALGDHITRMQVWDTAGQERFRAMAPLYYRKANAAIILYDITSSHSFQAMKEWVNELKKNVEEAIVIFIVGNKCDLNNHRVIERDEAQKYAYSIGANFTECSALSNEGINDMFKDLALMIVEMEKKASVNKLQETSTSLCYELSPSGSPNESPNDSFALLRTIRIEKLSSESIPKGSSCSC